jgi:hypothetical protein
MGVLEMLTSAAPRSKETSETPRWYGKRNRSNRFPTPHFFAEAEREAAPIARSLG